MELTLVQVHLDSSVLIRLLSSGTTIDDPNLLHFLCRLVFPNPIHFQGYCLGDSVVFKFNHNAMK